MGVRQGPPVLEFRKIKLEKSSLMNWIFSLQKSISKLIFADYTGSKNLVLNRLKIQFIELDVSKLIFQKPSTNQQGPDFSTTTFNHNFLKPRHFNHELFKLRPYFGLNSSWLKSLGLSRTKVIIHKLCHEQFLWNRN